MGNVTPMASANEYCLPGILRHGALIALSDESQLFDYERAPTWAECNSAPSPAQCRGCGRVSLAREAVASGIVCCVCGFTIPWPRGMPRTGSPTCWALDERGRRACPKCRLPYRSASRHEKP